MLIYQDLAAISQKSNMLQIETTVFILKILAISAATSSAHCQREDQFIDASSILSRLAIFTERESSLIHLGS